MLQRCFPLASCARAGWSSAPLAGATPRSISVGGGFAFRLLSVYFPGTLPGVLPMQAPIWKNPVFLVGVGATALFLLRPNPAAGAAGSSKSPSTYPPSSSPRGETPTFFFGHTSPEDFIRGCEGYFDDAPAELVFEEAPDYIRAGAYWLSRYVHVIRSIARENAPIRGWWRPGSCNESRGGADASRHLAGWAVDLDPSSAAYDRVWQFVDSIGGLDDASRWGDYVRSQTGWTRAVGINFYPRGKHLHIDFGCPEDAPDCSPRRSDWVAVDGESV